MSWTKGWGYSEFMYCRAFLKKENKKFKKDQKKFKREKEKGREGGKKQGKEENASVVNFPWNGAGAFWMLPSRLELVINTHQLSTVILGFQVQAGRWD